MGFVVVLRDASGEKVRQMPDPLGGIFDESGDFDDLLGRGRTPLLDTVDPHADTAFSSEGMATLAAEVDALLATIPESAKSRRGRAGSPWRGLTRLRVMVELCKANSGYRLTFYGD